MVTQFGKSRAHKFCSTLVETDHHALQPELMEADDNVNSKLLCYSCENVFSCQDASNV